MGTRIATALAMGGAMIAAVVLLPSWAWAAALGLLWLAGIVEWAHFARRRVIPTALYTAVFIGLVLISGTLFDSSGALFIASLGLIFWGLAAAALWAYPWNIPSHVALAAGPFALLPAWFLLAYLHHAPLSGPRLTLSLLIIIWAADSGAYLVGSRFGRVKLAPRISPGKTWEGVVGGLGSAALAAVVAGVALELPLVPFVAIALASTLLSVIGDLTVSMFKRNVGLKDSGRLLPGHGGVLDRIDSLAAAVPLFYLGLVVAGLYA